MQRMKMVTYIVAGFVGLPLFGYLLQEGIQTGNSVYTGVAVFGFLALMCAALIPIMEEKE